MYSSLQRMKVARSIDDLAFVTIEDYYNYMILAILMSCPAFKPGGLESGAARLLDHPCFQLPQVLRRLG
jgi:hypothetical protein